MTQSSKFRFTPLNFSWVALHPEPIGVIYYIGGAFFGTFPTIFYRHLLKSLFEQGYTIVAIPYRFTFRHWSVAVGIAKDQSIIQEILVNEAKHRSYEYKIYEEDQQLKSGNLFWLGHSLGCKYIALLELLTSLAKNNCNKQSSIRSSFGDCIPIEEQSRLEAALSDVDLEQISIRNQSSILMAPAIEGLEGAIPPLRNPRLVGIKKILNRIGIKVEPSRKETFCLIQRSQLFNLTSLIFFRKDTRVAAPTVRWLLDNLAQRLVQEKELKGKHLAPLGWHSSDPEIAKTVSDFLVNSRCKAEF